MARQFVANVQAVDDTARISYACQSVAPSKYRCGHCRRGVVWIDALASDRSHCRVCGLRFAVLVLIEQPGPRRLSAPEGWPWLLVGILAMGPAGLGVAAVD